MTAMLRKFAAVALLALLAAGFGFGLIWPAMQKLHDLDERIAVQRTILGRLKSAATGGQVERERNVSQENIYLPGETDSVRLAGLQSQLRTVTQVSGIRVDSVSATDSNLRAGVRMLGVHAQFTTELAALQTLLFEIEKRHDHLIVDQMTISRSPAAVPEKSTRLDVSLVVLGPVPAKE